MIFHPIFFHINSTSVIRLVKQNLLNFSSLEISKSFTTPVHSVSKIRFKLRSQCQLLPQIRCLITLRIERSIISLDGNIRDNIRKVINVYQQKCRTKNGVLRNSNINWIFFWRLPIKNHMKLSITEKRKKSKKLT